MESEKTIEEKLAEIKEGDFVKVFYVKQKNIVKMKAGYAHWDKYMDGSTIFNIYSEYGLCNHDSMKAMGSPLSLGLNPNEILKIEVLKKREEVASELESLLAYSRNR